MVLVTLHQASHSHVTRCADCAFLGTCRVHAGSSQDMDCLLEGEHLIVNRARSLSRPCASRGECRAWRGLSLSVHAGPGATSSRVVPEMLSILCHVHLNEPGTEPTLPVGMHKAGWLGTTTNGRRASLVEGVIHMTTPANVSPPPWPPTDSTYSTSSSVGSPAGAAQAQRYGCRQKPSLPVCTMQALGHDMKHKVSLFHRRPTAHPQHQVYHMQSSLATPEPPGSTVMQKRGTRSICTAFVSCSPNETAGLPSKRNETVPFTRGSYLKFQNCWDVAYASR